MSKSNAHETEYLALLYNATPVANIADNAATAPLTNLFLALHTADPGEAGDMTTSEVAYTGYARVAVPRTSGGFTVAGNQVSNAALVAFPAKTGGADQTATFFSIGIASSGAVKILHSGALTASFLISDGVTPQFAIGTMTVTED